MEGLFATVDSLLTLAVGFYDAPLPVALGHALDGGGIDEKTTRCFRIYGFLVCCQSASASWTGMPSTADLRTGTIASILRSVSSACRLMRWIS